MEVAEERTVSPEHDRDNDNQSEDRRQYGDQSVTHGRTERSNEGLG